MLPRCNGSVLPVARKVFIVSKCAAHHPSSHATEFLLNMQALHSGSLSNPATTQTRLLASVLQITFACSCKAWGVRMGQGGFQVLDVLSNDHLLDLLEGELCRRVAVRAQLGCLLLWCKVAIRCCT